MEDKKILANMIGSKTRKYHNRTTKIVEVANGIYDDFNDPNASTNKFYHKWIKLVQLHKDGKLTLSGSFTSANGFISFASQFSPSNVPTTELLGATHLMDETTTSFLAPVLFRALEAKNYAIITSYLQDKGDWELSKVEKATLNMLVLGDTYATS